MQREEFIAELIELGHEVSSHTCTHRILTEIPQSELEWELTESKKRLEDLTGREVLGLAYPYGLYNTHVIRATMEWYQYTRATDILPIDDPLNLDLTSTYIRRYIIGSGSLRSVYKVFTLHG